MSTEAHTERAPENVTEPARAGSGSLQEHVVVAAYILYLLNAGKLEGPL